MTVKKIEDINNLGVIIGYVVDGNKRVPIDEGNRDYREVLEYLAQFHVIGTPPSDDFEPQVGNLASEDWVPEVGTPPSEDYSPQVGTPPSDDYVPHVGIPTSDDYAHEIGTPPSGDYVAEQGTPASDDYVPASGGLPHDPGYVAGVGTPPSEDWVPEQGTPPSEDWVPQSGNLASVDYFPAIGTPPSEDYMPQIGTPASEDWVPEQGTPESTDYKPQVGSQASEDYELIPFAAEEAFTPEELAGYQHNKVAVESVQLIVSTVQVEIDRYNETHSLAFSSIEGLNKYTRRPTYTHYDFCVAVLDWNEDLWEHMRAWQGTLTEFPTMEDVQAKINELPFEGE